MLGYPSIRILFEDTDRPVELIQGEKIFEQLPNILPGWPFQVLAEEELSKSPFMTVEAGKSGYVVNSVYADSAKRIRNPVDVVCEMVARLAWATIELNPDWLCLHCAACEFNGGLVVFPNRRKSGKSTLVSVLGSRSIPIFTDDFLAMSLDNSGRLYGMASGAATRLRRPWPSNLSNDMVQQLQKNQTAASKTYSYHVNPQTMPVERGTKATIGAMVFLERDGKYAQATMQPIGKNEALEAIIVQNFARLQNAERILSMLHFLVSNIECYRLQFADAEQAADYLQMQFGSRELAAAPAVPKELRGGFASPTISVSSESCSLEPHLQIVRSDRAKTYEVEGSIFLVDQNGYGIHKLDAIGGAIWNLLAEPVTFEDVVEVLAITFPEISRERISADIEQLIRSLLSVHLVDQVKG